MFNRFIIISLSILVPKGKNLENLDKKYLFQSQNLSFEQYIYLFTYKNSIKLNIIIIISSCPNLHIISYATRDATLRHAILLG